MKQRGFELVTLLLDIDSACLPPDRVAIYRDADPTSGYSETIPEVLPSRLRRPTNRMYHTMVQGEQHIDIITSFHEGLQ